QACSGSGSAQLALSGPLASLATSAGSLWAAVDHDVYRLDATAAWTQPAPSWTSPRILRGMAARDDRVFLTHGAFGVSLVDTNDAELGASPALYGPAAGSAFAYRQGIALALADASGVNAVRYRINGQVVASVATAPFETVVPAP